MNILGIETSCDETAVCLIEGRGDFGEEFRFRILGNALISQAALHAEFGGVFPNLAKREHAKNLVPMLTQALREAGSLVESTATRRFDLHMKEILEREPELYARLSLFLKKYARPEVDAIAVTAGPGLEPALWVGINFAKALSIAWDVPIVAVNHMEGHIMLSMMEKGHLAGFKFPVLALLISGGHTELVLSKEFGQYQLIGQTRDDAAGEAFDKVARMLDLPYPGGPEISRLAHEARKIEVKPQSEVALPRPMIHEDNFDFSFSGLKTAVRRVIENHQGNASLDFKMQIAREFEDAVADVLVAKTMRAAEEFGAQTIVVGGGVSANEHIRLRLAAACSLPAANYQLLIPPPQLATDNATMIAFAGYFHAIRNEFADLQTLKATGNLTLA